MADRSPCGLQALRRGDRSRGWRPQVPACEEPQQPATPRRRYCSSRGDCRSRRLPVLAEPARSSKRRPLAHDRARPRRANDRPHPRRARFRPEGSAPAGAARRSLSTASGVRPGRGGVIAMPRTHSSAYAGSHDCLARKAATPHGPGPAAARGAKEPRCVRRSRRRAPPQPDSCSHGRTQPTDCPFPCPATLWLRTAEPHSSSVAPTQLRMVSMLALADIDGASKRAGR